ncbi:bifunctional metallophosphatase/5'-nucleotidase [Lacticaseibacillus paracasei]
MKLTILSTSDTHGFVLPTNYVKRDQDLPFSLAKAKTVLDAQKAAAEGPVVTIENGDWLQGSPLAYYVAKISKQPDQLTRLYNEVGYDAGIIGNHEFNYGSDYLRQALKTLTYPTINANITENGQPAFGAPYQLIERSGVKIAILGLTTNYIPHWEAPAHIAGLAFQDVVATAKHYVPLLRQQADVVIVAYHGGFERNLQTGQPTEPLTGENVGYALTQVPGIDALVTGHQHRQLAGLVNGVPITQPGYRGEAIGKITLDLNQTASGYQFTASKAVLVKTGGSIASPTILQSAADLNQTVETWLDQPLAHVEGDMRIQAPFVARVHEVPYIEFIQKVQMASTDTDISGTALFNNEGRGFGETIDMRDVVTNYIYPNTLAVLRLTGADLKAALEKCAEYFSLDADGKLTVTPRFERPKPQHYNYDMYQGIDYTLDIHQPVGSRVTRLLYHGAQVQPTQTYDVAVNQYRAAGGGNFKMFGPDKVIRENQKDMTELIADYLQEHPLIKATADQNFNVLPSM